MDYGVGYSDELILLICNLLIKLQQVERNWHVSVVENPLL